MDQERTRTGSSSDSDLAFLCWRLLLVGALLYGIGGVVSAALYWLARVGVWDSGTWAELASTVVSASRPVFLAALGVLGGAVLLSTHVRLVTERSTVQEGSDRRGRLLYWLLIGFTVVWAFTGIATSKERAEQEQFFFAPPTTTQEEPAVFFVTLIAVNHAAYNGGIACLVLLGASQMVNRVSR